MKGCNVETHREPMITSSDKVFEVSRRAMFAFAALPTLLAVSALAQTPVTDPLPPWKGKS